MYMALWLCGLALMSAPLSELLIHVIQLLECSIERAKHTVNMADVYESEYNECEETGVTAICVFPGIVFPAHISLGMRVSPHIYH